MKDEETTVDVLEGANTLPDETPTGEETKEEVTEDVVETEKSGETDESEETAQTSEGEGEEKPEKTFTQKEVNKFLADNKRNLRAENEDLRGRVEQFEGKDKETPLSETPEPKEGDFESNAEFVKAVTSWQFSKDKADGDAKARATKSDQDKQNMVNTYKDRVDSSNIREKHPDFDEVTGSRGHYGPAVKELVLTSEIGPELAYHLAQNEDTINLAGMSPLEAAKEVAKIEMKLTQKPNKITVTNATTPITPVSGNDVVKKSPDDMSQSEYEKGRQAGTI